MNDQNYKNFLMDFIKEISEKRQENIFEKDTDLWKGYNFALYEVMSLLVSQSEIFGLNKQDMGLDNIDPEKDFLI